jgi:ribosomal protein L32E
MSRPVQRCGEPWVEESMQNGHRRCEDLQVRMHEGWERPLGLASRMRENDGGRVN